MQSQRVSTGDAASASQYDNLRDDAYAASMLRPHQQTTPGMSLYVEMGAYYIGATRVLFAGGSTPAFTAPVSNPRIDLVTADSTGTIAIVQGTEGASPATPAYPANKAVLCEVYHVVGETAIYTSNNSAYGWSTGKGYIQNDVRPELGPIYISSSAQIAAQALDGSLMWNLPNIPSGAGVIPVANLPSNSFNAQTFTAAKTVTKGKPLILGTGISGYLTVNNQVGSTADALGAVGSGVWTGQTFTTSALTSAIRAVMVQTITTNFSSTSYGITIAIYAVDVNHKPTGSPIGYQGFTVSQNSTQTLTFTFSSPIAVSPTTEYAIVCESQCTGGGGGTISTTHNTSGYSSGYFLTTSNSGSTWTTNSSESLFCEAWETMTIAGEVQHSDTTQTVLTGDVYDLAYNFCGFAIANASGGTSVSVNLGPIDADQSGLTVGKQYFLNGSGGGIGTSAGTISVKVGIAVSPTQLLMKFDNY